MSDIHANQNLRLSQQMLKQQGEINELKRKLAKVRELLIPGPIGRGERYIRADLIRAALDGDG